MAKTTEFSERKPAFLVQILSALFMILIIYVIFMITIPVLNSVFNAFVDFVNNNAININKSGFYSLVSNEYTIVFVSFVIILIVLVVYILVLPWWRQHDTGQISPFMEILKRRHPGIFYDIVIVSFTLLLGALMLIAGGQVVNYLNSWQQTYYATGVFNPSYLAFFKDVWNWLAGILLFSSAFYLWMRAQKRRPQDYED